MKILLQTIKILFDKMSSQGLDEDENIRSLAEIDFFTRENLSLDGKNFEQRSRREHWKIKI